MPAERLLCSQEYPTCPRKGPVADRKILDDIADAWLSDGCLPDSPVGILTSSRSGVSQILKSVNN